MYFMFAFLFSHVCFSLTSHSLQTKVLPSLGISLRLTPKPTSVVHFTLLAEIVNYLRHIDLEGTAANEVCIGSAVF